MNSEVDILKKNIRELVELSNNEKICHTCSYINQVQDKKCSMCTSNFPTFNLELIDKSSKTSVEYERTKCVINYFMKLPLTFTPIPIPYTGPKKSAVIIMRHGIRADNCKNIKKVMKTNKYGKVKEEDEVTNKFTLSNNDTRLYDPPLLDYDLPLIRANEFINEYNITKIVSSPFRRCLQTAAIIAKYFGIIEIEINEKFGEERRAFSRYNIPIYTITEDIIKEALGDIQLTKKAGQSIIKIAENYNSNKDQFQEGINKYKGETNLLIVSHGDIFEMITDFYVDINGSKITKYKRDIILAEQEEQLNKANPNPPKGKYPEDKWPPIISAIPQECAYAEFDIDSKTILKSKGITYE